MRDLRLDATGNPTHTTFQKVSLTSQYQNHPEIIAYLFGTFQSPLFSQIVKFYNAPVDQIFEKYSEITGRTVLRSASLAATSITIITASPLTRTEAIQALDGALALNGVAMIKQAEKFVKAVPSPEAPLHGAAISNSKTGNIQTPNSSSRTWFI